MFPGYFPPEMLISAMEGGGADSLINNFERDKGRVASIIQRIRNETLMDEPDRLVFPNEDPGPQLDENGAPVPVLDASGQPVPQMDEETGMPVLGQDGQPMPEYQPATSVPGWMPRPFDSLQVHESLISEWMKTQDYESLPPEGKEQANLYYSAVLDLQSKKAQREAEQQSMMAMAQGEANAARPPAKPMPSQPALDNGGPPTS